MSRCELSMYFFKINLEKGTIVLLIIQMDVSFSHSNNRSISEGSNARRVMFLLSNVSNLLRELYMISWSRLRVTSYMLQASDNQNYNILRSKVVKWYCKWRNYFYNSTDTPLTAAPSLALLPINRNRPSRSHTCPVKYCFAVKASSLFHPVG